MNNSFILLSKAKRFQLLEHQTILEMWEYKNRFNRAKRHSPQMTKLQYGEKKNIKIYKNQL